MGRPIGSLNRQKPFTDALRMEIRAGNDPRHLRAIARKLIEMAEGGDLQAIKEVCDRLDGKCAQVIERGDVSVVVRSDRELFAIIRGGLREPCAQPRGTDCVAAAPVFLCIDFGQAANCSAIATNRARVLIFELFHDPFVLRLDLSGGTAELFDNLLVARRRRILRAGYQHAKPFCLPCKSPAPGSAIDNEFFQPLK
jgi:hypothetical protein